MVDWLKDWSPIIGSIVMIGIFIYNNSRQRIKEEFKRVEKDQNQIKANLKEGLEKAEQSRNQIKADLRKDLKEIRSRLESLYQYLLKSK